MNRRNLSAVHAFTFRFTTALVLFCGDWPAHCVVSVTVPAELLIPHSNTHSLATNLVRALKP